MHHRGIATLLFEHLVSAARSQGVTTFTAQTLAQNTPMLHLFADAGLPVQRHYDDGVAEVTIPLPADDTGTALDTFLETVARRERTADAASLRHVLAPESVVVIGASRRTGTPGRAILDNIRTCGYEGRLYAVHPQAPELGGVHCAPAVADLPEPPDLALIAVPAPAVLGVAEDCGRLGVKALAVITSGLDAAACADLLAVCRRHGMRLVGPDSFGIAVPGLGLDATFAASHPRPGVAGLVMQSGGVGLAMVDQLSRLGIGISSFASVGRKLDVSSNDMLLWWEQDEVTKLAVLYIESFGNPRKFGRTARRVGARIPVLTVHAGPFAADQDPASQPARRAGQPRGAVRASGHHRRARPRRAGRDRRAARHPARPGRPHGRDRVQRRRRRGARGGRVRRPRPDRAPAGRDYRRQAARADSAAPARSPARWTPPPRYPAKPSGSAWSWSRRTRTCTPSSRWSCPPAPPAT